MSTNKFSAAVRVVCGVLMTGFVMCTGVDRAYARSCFLPSGNCEIGIDVPLDPDTKSGCLLDRAKDNYECTKCRNGKWQCSGCRTGFRECTRNGEKACYKSEIAHGQLTSSCDIKCDDGYLLENDKCVINCAILPNQKRVGDTCECVKGYTMKDGMCEKDCPENSHDENGVCVCNSDSGYERCGEGSASRCVKCDSGNSLNTTTCECQYCRSGPSSCSTGEQLVRDEADGSCSCVVNCEEQGYVVDGEEEIQKCVITSMSMSMKANFASLTLESVSDGTSTGGVSDATSDATGSVWCTSQGYHDYTWAPGQSHTDEQYREYLMATGQVAYGGCDVCQRNSDYVKNCGCAYGVWSQSQEACLLCSNQGYQIPSGDDILITQGGHGSCDECTDSRRWVKNCKCNSGYHLVSGTGCVRNSGGGVSDATSDGVEDILSDGVSDSPSNCPTSSGWHTWSPEEILMRDNNGSCQICPDNSNLVLSCTCHGQWVNGMCVTNGVQCSGQDFHLPSEWEEAIYNSSHGTCTTCSDGNALWVKDCQCSSDYYSSASGCTRKYTPDPVSDGSSDSPSDGPSDGPSDALSDAPSNCPESSGWHRWTHDEMVMRDNNGSCQICPDNSNWVLSCECHGQWMNGMCVTNGVQCSGQGFHVATDEDVEINNSPHGTCTTCSDGNALWVKDCQCRSEYHYEVNFGCVSDATSDGPSDATSDCSGYVQYDQLSGRDALIARSSNGSCETCYTNGTTKYGNCSCNSGYAFSEGMSDCVVGNNCSVNGYSIPAAGTRAHNILTKGNGSCKKCASNTSYVKDCKCNTGYTYASGQGKCVSSTSVESFVGTIVSLGGNCNSCPSNGKKFKCTLNGIDITAQNQLCLALGYNYDTALVADSGYTAVGSSAVSNFVAAVKAQRLTGGCEQCEYTSVNAEGQCTQSKYKCYLEGGCAGYNYSEQQAQEYEALGYTCVRCPLAFLSNESEAQGYKCTYGSCKNAGFNIDLTKAKKDTGAADYNSSRNVYGDAFRSRISTANTRYYNNEEVYKASYCPSEEEGSENVAKLKHERLNKFVTENQCMSIDDGIGEYRVTYGSDVYKRIKKLTTTSTPIDNVSDATSDAYTQTGVSDGSSDALSDATSESTNFCLSSGFHLPRGMEEETFAGTENCSNCVHGGKVYVKNCGYCSVPGFLWNGGSCVCAAPGYSWNGFQCTLGGGVSDASSDSASDSTSDAVSDVTHEGMSDMSIMSLLSASTQNMTTITTSGISSDKNFYTGCWRCPADISNTYYTCRYKGVNVTTTAEMCEVDGAISKTELLNYPLGLYSHVSEADIQKYCKKCSHNSDYYICNFAAMCEGNGYIYNNPLAHGYAMCDYCLFNLGNGSGFGTTYSKCTCSGNGNISTMYDPDTHECVLCENRCESVSDATSDAPSDATSETTVIYDNGVSDASSDAPTSTVVGEVCTDVCKGYTSSTAKEGYTCYLCTCANSSYYNKYKCYANPCSNEVLNGGYSTKDMSRYGYTCSVVASCGGKTYYDCNCDAGKIDTGSECVENRCSGYTYSPNLVKKGWSCSGQCTQVESPNNGNYRSCTCNGTISGSYCNHDVVSDATSDITRPDVVSDATSDTNTCISNNYHEPSESEVIINNSESGWCANCTYGSRLYVKDCHDCTSPGYVWQGGTNGGCVCGAEGYHMNIKTFACAYCDTTTGAVWTGEECCSKPKVWDGYSCATPPSPDPVSDATSDITQPDEVSDAPTPASCTSLGYHQVTEAEQNLMKTQGRCSTCSLDRTYVKNCRCTAEGYVWNGTKCVCDEENGYYGDADVAECWTEIVKPDLGFDWDECLETCSNGYLLDEVACECYCPSAENMFEYNGQCIKDQCVGNYVTGGSNYNCTGLCSQAGSPNYGKYKSCTCNGVIVNGECKTIEQACRDLGFDRTSKPTNGGYDCTQCEIGGQKRDYYKCVAKTCQSPYVAGMNCKKGYEKETNGYAGDSECVSCVDKCAGNHGSGDTSQKAGYDCRSVCTSGGVTYYQCVDKCAGYNYTRDATDGCTYSTKCEVTASPNYGKYKTKTCPDPEGVSDAFSDGVSGSGSNNCSDCSLKWNGTPGRFSKYWCERSNGKSCDECRSSVRNGSTCKRSCSGSGDGNQCWDDY